MTTTANNVSPPPVAATKPAAAKAAAPQSPAPWKLSVGDFKLEDGRVAFVDRGETRRIISLRRANRREVKHYVQNI